MLRITGRKEQVIIIQSYYFYNIFFYRFFSSLDWEDLYYKQLKPPIIPKIRSQADTRNYADYPETDWRKAPEVSARQICLFDDF